MQDEADALGRSERLEDDEQRETDRLGEQRFLLGIEAAALACRACDRLGYVRVKALIERVFAARIARAQHVQADACDDRGEPSAEVFDAAGVGATQLEPGFLNGVVCFADGAEHSVGDGAQMASIFLEWHG